MRRRVRWEPLNVEGTSWIAWYNGCHRGYVSRMYNRRYVARIFGRRARAYATTMREAGKQLVAFVNGVPPVGIL